MLDIKLGHKETKVQLKAVFITSLSHLSFVVFHLVMKSFFSVESAFCPCLLPLPTSVCVWGGGWGVGAKSSERCRCMTHSEATITFVTGRK